MTAYATDHDPAFIAELTAYLAAQGYKVTKTRAPRAGATSTDARADGCKPARSTSGLHAGCVEHWRVPGMRKAVCVTPAGTIREDGRDTGEPIGPEWVETDAVLAFALELARIGEAHAARDRAGIEERERDRIAAYTGGPVAPERVFEPSTYSPELARQHRIHAGIDGKAWTPYGIRTGCEECAGQKETAEATAARKIEQDRMAGIAHAFTSESSYMATCTACGQNRRHEAHTWTEHPYVNKYGRCTTCERTEDEHDGIGAIA